MSLFVRFPGGVFNSLPAGNHCHFVLLDKDDSCPTADLSDIGRPNGPAYSTGELFNTPLDFLSETGKVGYTYFRQK